MEKLEISLRQSPQMQDNIYEEKNYNKFQNIYNC